MSFEIIIPFLKPIEHLLMNPAIPEIMVNPDGSVWIEEKGHIRLQPGVRFDDGALLTGLIAIANRFRKKLDADSPITDLHLPDGIRIAAIILLSIQPQPLLSVRKFTSKNVTLNDMIKRKALTEAQAET